jgi:hypothetical protein
MDDEETKRFRKVFVVEPSHDLTALKKYTDDIRFITTGYEDIGKIGEKIDKNISEFDPSQDAIVALGRVSVCMLIGICIAKKFPDKKMEFGVYSNKDYTFEAIQL